MLTLLFEGPWTAPEGEGEGPRREGPRLLLRGNHWRFTYLQRVTMEVGLG
jgi:hypothetical protein